MNSDKPPDNLTFNSREIPHATRSGTGRRFEERILACAELLEASGWCVALHLADDRLWLGSNATTCLERASFRAAPETWIEFSRMFQTGFGGSVKVDEPHIKIWGGRESETSAPSKCGLTKRESQVLNLLGSGKTSPEIAIILSCSVRTAEKHVGNIYRKLGVRNRASVILEASTGEEPP